MSNNMKDRFVSSNFDEVDLVLDTDRRFEEAIAAADAGEEDLVDAIVKEMKESGAVNTVVEEEDVMEYNPEWDDADNILDATAEDVREYISDEDYMGDDEDVNSLLDDYLDQNPQYQSYDYDDED